jgi:hypothetical protein
MALPNADDGIRAPSGVVVSLRPTSEGRLCVVLDDVRQQPAADVRSWTHESFFTISEYSRRELENLDLSKDQFAQIGENIVIRLLALSKAGKPHGGYGAV